MANRYSKALKHLKSTEIDEKIKGLEEAAPTNNMGGIYYTGPAGQRLGNRSREKVFYPDADGNFPSGIPGTAGDPSYTRPEGYWDSGPGATVEVEYDNVYEVDWSHPDSSNVTDTSGLIENNGYVKAQLPPGSRSFILGPLVDGYTRLHGYDDYTNIGYIQKDTRQFILLARIHGHWNTTDAVYGSSVASKAWDGTSTGFTSYNENFTLAMAQWFRNKILNGKSVGKNVSYYYSGGIPQSGNSDPDAPSGSKGGNGVGGPGHGKGGEDGANIGSKQNDPEQGDPKAAGFPWFPFGDLGKKAKELWDKIKDAAGDIKDNLEEFFDDAFDDAVEGAKDFRDSLQDALDSVGDFAQDAASKVGDAASKVGDAVDDAVDAAKKIPEKAAEAWDWYVDNKEAVDAAAGSVMNAVDAAMAIASVVGVVFPEAGTSVAGALGIASLTSKVKKAYNAAKAGKSVADVLGGKNKGLTGGGSYDVGATGVKKGGFDALDPNQIGPKAQHTGSKGILSPGGGDVYSAPKVGEVGPSAINPGTGAAKYTKHGSNPFSQSSQGGGVEGGVIGSLTHKGAKSIDVIEPQSTQTPAQFDKSSKLFNDIMNGKYQNSPTAQKIYQKGIDAGFTTGGGSIKFSDIPKQTSVPNVNKTQGAFSKFASHGSWQTQPRMRFDQTRRESFTLSDLIESASNNVDEDKIDYMIIDMFSNPEFVEKVPELIKGLELETEIADAYGILFGYEDKSVDKKKVKESNSIRKVKFVMEDATAAPAPTTPTNQTTTQQPTESKQTADALAKEYLEKNGPDKTKELIDKTDEYLAAHGAGEEPSPHTQSEVDRENIDQEVESEIDNNDEFSEEEKETHRNNMHDVHRQISQIDNLGDKPRSKAVVKTENNLKIAWSVITSRVGNHDYPSNWIDEWIGNINNSVKNNTTGGFGGFYMPIVSDELEYADDNIYVEDGIIKNNTSDTQQQVHTGSLANEEFFAGIGAGQSQLVIPSDGGVPYIIYKDYNYHNLRSQSPAEIPGGEHVGQDWLPWWQKGAKMWTHFVISKLSSIAHLGGDFVDAFGFTPKGSLGSGWPEGIHGAVYTEFRRNLDELPEELQNMIKAHPLYWTDGRYGELFADEQATEDEFIRILNETRSLPNGDNIVSNLQKEAFNKPEYSNLRSLFDQYNVGWEEYQTNEKEIEKLKRQLYYDFNSKYWGGYTDQDPDSPTFNTWIETPEKEFKFHDLPRQEQFELVGVSYPDFVKAEKALGLTSDGERAHWRQILDGEQGLTGLAGKTVEAGDKLREIEKEFFAEFPESKNGGIFRTNDKAEAARWTKMYNKHQSAMTAYMKAWEAWDVAADPVYDTLNSVNDKYYQEYKPNEKDEYLKKKDEFEKQIEKLQYDWGVKQEELDGQMEPLMKQMFQDQIKMMHSTYWDKKHGGRISGESYEQPGFSPIDYKYDYTPKEKDPFSIGAGTPGGIGGTGDAGTAADLAGERRRRRRNQGASVVPEVYKPKGRRLQESDLNLSRRKVRMLKEIKKPVVVPELPKKYKMNFKGRFRPQNTPDVTASKESDKGVKAKNAAGQAWRTKDKSWATYETNERMNIIFDQVGHGNQAWDMIVAEAKRKNGWKNREIQEQLNIIAHEKAMRAENPDYESPWSLNEMGASSEEELNTVMKDPLVKKVAKRLKQEIDYKDKPARQGYPDKPPAKQVDGWHPKYGKKYKYDKLDPVSADTMSNAPTGNPEIDANVEKARKQPKVKEEYAVDWRSAKSFFNLAPNKKKVLDEFNVRKNHLHDHVQEKEKQRSDTEMQEAMTSSGVFGRTLASKGDVDLEVVQTGLTGDGGIDYGEDGFATFEVSGNSTHTGDGEYTGVTAWEPTDTAPDPTGVGTRFRPVGYNGVLHSSMPLHMRNIPGYKGGVGGSSHTSVLDIGRGYAVSGGKHGHIEDPEYGKHGGVHEYTVDELGKTYPSYDNTNGLTDRGHGTAVIFKNEVHWAPLKPIDTSEYDTIKLRARVDRNNLQSPADAVQLYYWAGDKPGFQSLKLDNPITTGGQTKPFDGWRPLYQKPDGSIDDSVSHIIIPWIHDRDNSYENHNLLVDYSQKIPEWCRGKNTRFIIYGSGSTNNAWAMTSVRFQRRGNVTITTPLDSPEASAFVRVGQGSADTSPEQRKKKIEDMLKASRLYMMKVLGYADFPGMGATLDSIAASPIGFDKIYDTHAATLSSKEKSKFRNAISDRRYGPNWQHPTEKGRNNKVWGDKGRGKIGDPLYKNRGDGKYFYKVTSKDSRGLTKTAISRTPESVAAWERQQRQRR